MLEMNINCIFLSLYSNCSGYFDAQVEIWFICLQVVGSWFNSLKMNLKEVVWHKNSTDPPTSACSLPCEPGKIKKQQVFRSHFKCFVKNKFSYMKPFSRLQRQICWTYLIIRHMYCNFAYTHTLNRHISVFN